MWSAFLTEDGSFLASYALVGELSTSFSSRRRGMAECTHSMITSMEMLKLSEVIMCGEGQAACCSGRWQELLISVQCSFSVRSMGLLLLRSPGQYAYYIWESKYTSGLTRSVCTIPTFVHTPGPNGSYSALCMRQGTSAEASEHASGAMTMLEEHLLLKTFLAGENITIADISVFCALNASAGAALKGKASFPVSISRWMSTCENQPHFR